MKVAENTAGIKNNEINYRNILSRTGTGILFSLVFAVLMGISANSFFYLPFTPVPVTMQVFTVLLSALFLGKYWAMLAQIEYVILGLYGLPVFAGFKSGLAALSGPTGGYITGFIFGAFITGYVNDIFKARQNETGRFITGTARKAGYRTKLAETTSLFLSCTAGLAVIYLSGYIHLAGFFLTASKDLGAHELMLKALKLGVAPFILFDLLKIILILGFTQLVSEKK